ncbi:uncharacterized protein N7483_001143 [Penicillium malachiteum]|uniref:uncharacterized protein n=1 Tax=Penicillium malachiteum TaxID=1324776 RepID=UPI0025484201|nr:uncharacterized protein N7483_001143 [Penicillium malachiteum]KAJ5736018.1 hypothetical protein N7483_001143 [Penicillium malachiteum]
MADNSTFPFTITEHVIDGQHIREYPDATVDGSSSLKLVLKKYTPVNNPNPQPGDVTIIGAHGCGFPKELYEPLWEDILSRSEQDGYRIRSIWIADVSNLGASSIQNEKVLGNDPSWLDHSRDLLHMINKFRDEMPQPIVGVGHSMGAGQLVLLSLLHPRLFTSLSLVEPVIAPDIITGKGPLLSIVSLKRRDTWKSRSAAIEAAQKAHKKWDKRVLDRWILHAYRDLPTSTSTQSTNSEAIPTDNPVTLTSSKYQEVLQYLRPNPSSHLTLGEEPQETPDTPPHDPLLYPDIIGDPETTNRFYRFEPIFAWKMLKHVRPPVQYVLGKSSPIFSTENRTKMVERTGRGIGGSGGVRAGRVEQKIIKGSHQLPLEQATETASAVGPWISKSIRIWEEDEVRVAEGWARQPLDERLKGMSGWIPELQKMMEGDTPRRDSRL